MVLRWGILSKQTFRTSAGTAGSTHVRVYSLSEGCMDSKVFCLGSFLLAFAFVLLYQVWVWGAILAVKWICNHGHGKGVWVVSIAGSAVRACHMN